MPRKTQMMKVVQWIGRHVIWFLAVFRKPEVRIQAEAKRSRKRIKRQWSLGDLLDSLDAEHKRWELKFNRHSWIHKREWKALRTLGPHIMPKDVEFVPNPARDDLFDVPAHWQNEPFPVLMHVGWRNMHVDDIHAADDDKAWGTSVWAIRLKKSDNWRLEKTPGVLYMAGAMIEWFGDKKDDPGRGKELAVCLYITVDMKAKKFYVPKILQNVDVPISSGGMYCRREWGIPGSYSRDVYNKYPGRFENPEDASARLVLMEFQACMEAWISRKEYYQVSTRKGKGRVTFCIGKGEQKFFFKDRDKTAMASDGKRKRIVHYVGEFTRVNGQYVKEHLRGIRQFRWKGYDIAIMVPSFHIATYNFDIEPENEESMVVGRKYIDAKIAMAELAELEETRIYRHGRQN